MRGGGPRWRVGVIVSLCIAAVILIARAVIPAPNAPGWPLMVLIAVGCGFALGVGVPALTSVFPSEVIVSPKGINRNGISGVFFTVEFWPWDDIGACSVESLPADGRSFHALILHGPAEAAIGAIGFDSRPPLRDLEAYLSERGKRLERRAV
jgi:hypothetical protein